MSTSPIPDALQVALQRLCSDEELAPEHTVFISDGGGHGMLPQGQKPTAGKTCKAAPCRWPKASRWRGRSCMSL
jgi:hypothetical protein